MANSGFGDANLNSKGLLSESTKGFDANDYSLSKCSESVGKASELINDYSMSKGLNVPKVGGSKEVKSIKGF